MTESNEGDGPTGHRTTAAFTCPRCGRTSHDPTDAEQGYCGGCHDWTGPDVPYCRKAYCTLPLGHDAPPHSPLHDGILDAGQPYPAHAEPCECHPAAAPLR